MEKMPPKIQKMLGIAVFAVVFSLAFSLVALANEPLGITKEEVIQMVNDSREKEGVKVLAENEKLSQAAAAKAEDMLKENYFAHNSPSGKTPWFWIEQAGYDYHYAGENLAMDFKNADEQHSAWMKSPTHKKNILNKDFQEIGVAVRQGFIEGHLAIITVQEFGTSMNFVPSPSSGKTPVPQVQAVEKQTTPALKPVTILDKSQLDDSLWQKKMPASDWNNLLVLYLKTLMLMAIFVVNPFIIAFLIVQFIRFKAENEKKLALKEQA
jgi:hypothetical protein